MKLDVETKDSYWIYSYYSLYLDSIEVYLGNSTNIIGSSMTYYGGSPHMVTIPCALADSALLENSKMIKALYYLEKPNKYLMLPNCLVKLYIWLSFTTPRDCTFKSNHTIALGMLDSDYSKYILKIS